jgi:hypothetical protein
VKEVAMETPERDSALRCPAIIIDTTCNRYSVIATNISGAAKELIFFSSSTKAPHVSKDALSSVLCSSAWSILFPLCFPKGPCTSTNWNVSLHGFYSLFNYFFFVFSFWWISSSSSIASVWKEDYLWFNNLVNKQIMWSFHKLMVNTQKHG